ncbi:TPA: hypothetical protein NJV00_000856 [Corynebacterium striatum]|nr:hypothetical protein [Corynebacterium striatum]HAT1288963.1 hypothetical protein [Corynebacterium striatum]HAT1344830.1 hypothetical protein [Corynebacterium striatum]HAT1415343.1 hypothetical protein [Corynebacterium striatum]HAT6525318.1 hypothetical protein [Corynebacterium striatum]
MLVFAQPDDVVKWAGYEFDDAVKLEPLIRRASSMVQRAVRSARFEVTPAGMPEDPDVMDALRDAVCEQVTVWVENDINPTAIASAVGGLTSSSIGDGTVSYSTVEAAQVKDQAANELCDAALDILANAGLIGGWPWVR